MQTRTTTWTALVCSLAFAMACGPTSTPTETESDGGTQTGNNDAGTKSDDGFKLCSSTNKCPAGQFCFNGMCGIGCQSNADCASDQYCDTEDFIGPPYACKNKTVQSCPSSPCAENQVCRDGLCSAKEVPNTQCTPSPSFNDGCDHYAVCIDEDEEGSSPPACLSFPACPENGVCPTGTMGAVCNDGFIQNKGRFCMPGVCRDSSNCPAEWKCVKQTSNQVLGFCSPGGPFDLCFQNADCLSNVCGGAGSGFPGFCE